VPGAEITSFGPEGRRWSLPQEEAARQAIASLRGYVYQLHQSAAAWINLPENDQLYLEVAEDFAQIAQAPERLDEVLNATQIKDTRESGSVTLNSADVQAAIRHLFDLQEANRGRIVRLTFLTTSPIGVERKAPLASGEGGEPRRYVIFQMAEVAIARQMFQEILRLIAELRPQPPPALA
jgi:hypothetical protein